MAAVGMSQAAIDHVSTWLDAMEKIVPGRQDELPDHGKKDLAGQADAELSGAEQSAAIVDQQRRADRLRGLGFE